VRSFEVRSRSGNYPVLFIEKQELKMAFDLCAGSAFQPDDCLVIADSNTESIAQLIRNALVIAKKPIVIPHGELSKSLEMAEYLYGKLLELGANRSTVLLAVGGGVVGDLTGFVAGTYMRGIRYLQVPTTLMAQVDSSIGGKVGVNLSAGKNLVGLFYPPLGVIAIPELLATLPLGELKSGFVELAKQHALANKELFSLLENLKSLTAQEIAPLVADAANVKIKIVSDDEFEQSDSRMLLNLGHTVGHAIERGCNYEGISHGEAVALGILLEHSFLNSPVLDRFKKMFDKLKILPQALPTHFSLEGAISSMASDKKAVGNSIKLPILGEIGHTRIEVVNIPTLANFLRTTGLLSDLFLR